VEANMQTYQKPSVTDIGSLHELTLTGGGSVITKNAGSGDVIVINGVSESVPGGGVISVS